MAGFLNPFLLIVTPFILFLGLSCTYFLMMLTNVDNFFYIFKSIITLKMPLTKSFIVGVVFHFFLGLDLLGSMIVLFNNKE